MYPQAGWKAHVLDPFLLRFEESVLWLYWGGRAKSIESWRLFLFFWFFFSVVGSYLLIPAMDFNQNPHYYCLLYIEHVRSGQARQVKKVAALARFR